MATNGELKDAKYVFGTHPQLHCLCQLAGTPIYMAPELLENRASNEKVDVSCENAFFAVRFIRYVEEAFRGD